VRVRFLPRSGYGEEQPPITFGTHHIRAGVPAYPLRLTTDAPITHVIEHNPMLIDDCYTFVLGPDETLQSSPSEAGRVTLEETQGYWRRWVRNLAVPFDWQDAVMRAAITLKLNIFDDTGAVIAALTTSVPEAPNTERNWDYRYCWFRDAYFVINALNRLGATGSLERYLRYIENIVVESDPASLQPVYGLSGESRLTERLAIHLAGFEGRGPVRVGNRPGSRCSTTCTVQRSSVSRMRSSTTASTRSATVTCCSDSSRSESRPTRSTCSQTPASGSSAVGAKCTLFPR
jgi:hypothetical protein